MHGLSFRQGVGRDRHSGGAPGTAKPFTDWHFASREGQQSCAVYLIRVFRRFRGSAPAAFTRASGSSGRPGGIPIQSSGDSCGYGAPGHVPSPGMKAIYPGWLMRPTNGSTSHSSSSRISSNASGVSGGAVAQSRAQLCGGGRAHDRPRRSCDPVDEHVDRSIAQPAHRLGIERERRVAGGGHGATVQA
jgi:hypothetical protein